MIKNDAEYFPIVINDRKVMMPDAPNPNADPNEIVRESEAERDLSRSKTNKLPMAIDKM